MFFINRKFSIYSLLKKIKLFVEKFIFYFILVHSYKKLLLLAKNIIHGFINNFIFKKEELQWKQHFQKRVRYS